MDTKQMRPFIILYKQQVHHGWAACSLKFIKRNSLKSAYVVMAENPLPDDSPAELMPAEFSTEPWRRVRMGDGLRETATKLQRSVFDCNLRLDIDI
jgi:hypothetical protein